MLNKKSSEASESIDNISPEKIAAKYGENTNAIEEDNDELEEIFGEEADGDNEDYNKPF